MSNNRCVCFVVLAFLAGCSTKPPKDIQVAVTSSQTEANSQPLLPHPEFENWNRFPVQSYVIRKRTVTNENGQVSVRTKLWLEEKNSTGVQVGSEVTTQRDGEDAVENPADFVRYPAEFRLPKGLEPERFYLPSIKAAKLPDESLKIGEAEFVTEVFEWEENNEAGPMTVKVWRSLDVPGRIVRQEMLTKSSNTKVSEMVSELVVSDQNKTIEKPE